MNFSLVNIVFIFSLFFSSISFAQENIAVIDLEKAAIASDQAKKAIDSLKNSDSFKKNLEEYKKLGEEFKGLQEQGKVNALTWSDQQKKAHNETLKSKLDVINKIGKQLDAEKTAVEKRMFEELNPKINKVLPEILKEKNIGLLLDARAALYKTPAFDLTQELTERLNKAD